jgi:CRP-like cAMP-binding protein
VIEPEGDLMARREIAEVLKSAALFRELSDTQLETVTEAGTERTFPAGETIIREGDTGARAFWVICSGSVEVRTGDTLLATLGDGEYFGEMALVSGKDTPRSADVIAVEDTTVLQLTRWDLRGLIASNADLALRLLAGLAERLRRTDHSLAE